jgi:hypothetical protein
MKFSSDLVIYDLKEAAKLLEKMKFMKRIS